MEAIPISGITAETVANAFFHGWVSCYGLSFKLTINYGAQFESALRHGMASLGINRIGTTSYHPLSNGPVERLHRQLRLLLNPTLGV